MTFRSFVRFPWDLYPIGIYVCPCPFVQKVTPQTNDDRPPGSSYYKMPVRKSSLLKPRGSYPLRRFSVTCVCIRDTPFFRSIHRVSFADKRRDVFRDEEFFFNRPVRASVASALNTHTCMCILMRSRGAETVLDTAADIPPAAQCRDQTSNSVKASAVGVVLLFDVMTEISLTYY